MTPDLNNSQPHLRTVPCPDPTCTPAQVTVPEGTQVGDVLTCQTCFSDMEVIALTPEVKVELIVESK